MRPMSVLTSSTRPVSVPISRHDVDDSTASAVTAPPSSSSTQAVAVHCRCRSYAP